MAALNLNIIMTNRYVRDKCSDHSILDRCDRLHVAYMGKRYFCFVFVKKQLNWNLRCERCVRKRLHSRLTSNISFHLATWSVTLAVVRTQLAAGSKKKKTRKTMHCTRGGHMGAGHTIKCRHFISTSPMLITIQPYLCHSMCASLMYLRIGYHCPIGLFNLLMLVVAYALRVKCKGLGTQRRILTNLMLFFPSFVRIAEKKSQINIYSLFIQLI